jgi:hypothetical protein
MDNKLFEIMKKYDISLKDFIEKLKIKKIDEQTKINILYSLFQQGLVYIILVIYEKRYYTQ